MSNPCNEDYVLSDDYLCRMTFLKDCCRGKRVLHLGCSSGRYILGRMERQSHLHVILSQETQELYGIDIHEPSLQMMRDWGFDRLYLGDVERLEEVELADEPKFDVIIAGDLLEHLSKPGAMLEGAKRFLDPERGKIVITTNNAFGLHYQLKRWLGRYKEHFEHVCFFSPETLFHLLERHGYRVEEMHGAYTEPPYTSLGVLQFRIGKPLFMLAPVLAGTLIAVASLGSEPS